MVAAPMMIRMMIDANENVPATVEATRRVQLFEVDLTKRKMKNGKIGGRLASEKSDGWR